MDFGKSVRVVHASLASQVDASFGVVVRWGQQQVVVDDSVGTLDAAAFAAAETCGVGSFAVMGLDRLLDFRWVLDCTCRGSCP